MVAGYIFSKEGDAEFAKLEQTYPKSLQDEQYDDWLRETDATLLSKYSRHKEKEVTQIRRVKAEDDNEYLVYSYVQYRLDKALNVTHRWRPQEGKYPVPIAEYQIVRQDFGKEERKFKDIINIEEGYSIPYSKANVDKIRDLGLSLDGKVQYLVETPQRIRIGVASYEDFRNGVFEELVRFSKIPTEAQRKAWLETEGGVEADRQRLNERQRMIEERDIPAQIPTTREVKLMIEDAVKAQRVSKEEAQVLKKVEVEGKPEEQAVKEVDTTTITKKQNKK